MPGPNSKSAPARRPLRRRTTAGIGSSSRKMRGSAWFRSALAVAGGIFALLVWAGLARSFVPLSNTSRTQFDAILVLGTPADSDGNPTPEMLARVTEGVHEYRRGVAPHLIVTGAAAHNRFVEAEVMARVAEAQGVPSSAILKETQALDTIQNACYSARILEAHEWHSVEVVSSAPHLPRAAMIFARLASANPREASLQWHMRAAHDVLAPGALQHAAAIVETLKTARYLLWARWFETCNP